MPASRNVWKAVGVAPPDGRSLPGANEPITEAGLAELEVLVDRAGWPASRRVVAAVTGTDRREDLATISHRELATLRIALTVLAEMDGARQNAPAPERAGPEVQGG